MKLIYLAKKKTSNMGISDITMLLTENPNINYIVIDGLTGSTFTTFPPFIYTYIEL